MNTSDTCEIALHCAAKYNASTKHEQERWILNSIFGWTAYSKGELSSAALKNLQDMCTCIASFYKVFSGELIILRLDRVDLLKAITMIYAAETNFGLSIKTSSTGVVGSLQVTVGTFRSLVKQGILGNKAAKFLGYSTKKDLANLTYAQVRCILRTEKGSFISGTGKYLQTLF